MVFQVAKLMHDDVLDTMDGRFYQVQVKCDTAIGAAASPAPAHGADQQYRFRNAMARSNGERVSPYFSKPFYPEHSSAESVTHETKTIRGDGSSQLPQGWEGESLS